jgi:expansin (peptidoglycan-binding protein)
MEELEKAPKELKGTATLYVEQQYELSSTPELLSLAAYVSVVGHHSKRGPLDLQTLYAPVQGNTRAKKGEWVGRGVEVGGYGGLLE